MEEVLSKLSEELGLPQSVITKIYKAYWLSIKQIIEELPLREADSLDNIKHSISVLPLGKIYVSDINFKEKKRIFQDD